MNVCLDTSMSYKLTFNDFETLISSRSHVGSCRGILIARTQIVFSEYIVYLLVYRQIILNVCMLLIKTKYILLVF